MPFGLTDVPTTFCKMVAIAFDDMINKDLVIWKDDICLADDNFESKLAKRWKVFKRYQVKV